MIQPLADRVLVKQIEAEEKTKGGILLPETSKEKPQEGIVLAVGNGKTLDNGQTIPVAVKVGDKILFSKYSGTEVTQDDGDKALIMKEDDILAVKK